MADKCNIAAELFGPGIGPLGIERCKTSLQFSLGQSPAGSAPVAVRVAEGDGYTVRAAAVSGFAVPCADALFSVRLSVAGLSGVEILTGEEVPSTNSQALTVGGLANATKLSMALRAAAAALEALGGDVLSGTVERAFAPIARVPASRVAKPSEIAPSEMIGMAEAVRLSGLSRQSLWVAWKRKKLLAPPVHVGGRPQWPRQVFYDFMNSRRLPAQRT